MQSQKNQGHKVDFLWRCQTTGYSSDAQLLNYLRGDSIIPLREKMLQAIRAFWKPFAFQNDPQSRELALEAIYALEKHADYLRSHFDLDLPQPKPTRRRRKTVTPDELEDTEIEDESDLVTQLDTASLGEFQEFF